MVCFTPSVKILIQESYESERYKMPSLFLSVKETSAIAERI
jgi:hypothetical protein